MSDYSEVVEKFDNCRACLAYVYKAMTGCEPNPPDDWDGEWHDWLIQEVEKIIDHEY